MIEAVFSLRKKKKVDSEDGLLVFMWQFLPVKHVETGFDSQLFTHSLKVDTLPR